MHTCSICGRDLPEAAPQEWRTEDGESVSIDQTATPCAVVDTSAGEITVCERCYGEPPAWLTRSDLRELHYQFGLEYRDFGDHQRSIQCLQSALLLGKSADIFFALGFAYGKTGAPDLEKDHYHRALELDPNHGNSAANFRLVTEYPVTDYQCGARAGDRVRLRRDVAMHDHTGAPTDEVHHAGEIWSILRGAAEEPLVVWLRQADGETHTWSDDEDFLRTFEILPRGSK